MNYKQTLDILYNMLPDFQQVGAEAYKPGLERVRTFMDVLGNPYKGFKSIHIAGTNGKGSVSHMLASVLQAQGYKTGLYTSPHLMDFRERIRIDGQSIEESSVVGFAEKYMPVMEELKLSFFEATVGMAFLYFQENGVDTAVIETGLGGRLDATNIIDPCLSIITNIGLDHMYLLGDTIPLIAAEKAGIIKPRVPVVVGDKSPETIDVFESAGAACETSVFYASDLYQYLSTKNINQHSIIDPLSTSEKCPALRLFELKNLATGTIEKYELDLGGLYQRHNLMTVLSAIEVLNSRCGFNIEYDSMKLGLRTVTKSTGLRGRWEIAGHNPLVVLDTAHNEHGIREVVTQIEQEQYEELHMVIGVVKDKDIDSVLPLLPKKARYIFTQPSVNRALPAHELASAAKNYGLEGIIVEDVQQAVNMAVSLARKEDMIFIGGSNFTVADALQR